MPKAKKIRSAALESQQARHAPLGQVIDGDQMRGKYAAPIRYGRKKREAEAGEAEFLDEKTTKKILELSNQQREEIVRYAIVKISVTVNDEPCFDATS